MRLSLLATFLTLSSTTLAAPRGYAVKESIVPPRGWEKLNTPAPDHKIVLRIGLPQPNFSVLEKHLYEVSDPYHERYGAHLSKEDVESLVAPQQESIDVVDEWLATHGITESDISRSPAKDWVTLKIPVNLVEKMLDTVRFSLSRSPMKYFLHAHRLTTFGSTAKVAITLFEQRVTVYQVIFTIILI